MFVVAVKMKKNLYWYWMDDETRQHGHFYGPDIRYAKKWKTFQGAANALERCSMLCSEKFKKNIRVQIIKDEETVTA